MTANADIGKLTGGSVLRLLEDELDGVRELTHEFRSRADIRILFLFVVKKENPLSINAVICMRFRNFRDFGGKVANTFEPTLSEVHYQLERELRFENRGYPGSR